MKWNERITIARERKGLSKTDFWRAMKISSATATNWENGKVVSIKGENLMNACRVLGVSEEWLLYGKENVVVDADTFTPEMLAIIDLMRTLDQRGQIKVLSAAQDIAEEHIARQEMIAKHKKLQKIVATVEAPSEIDLASYAASLLPHATRQSGK